ncbi:MAG: cation:proton antiporter [Candidatus Nanohaloarchaea archaeon]|nr:cation:proton antiporter [Candidatus Nanohaloarchaea archaeon]
MALGGLLPPISPDMLFLLFLSLIYLFTLVIGNLLERIRIPWIFAALILGVLIAPFTLPAAMTGETFRFLAQLGMYFLLFLIGFEIDLHEMLQEGRHIAGAAFFIILLEGVLGSLMIHYVFGYAWPIAALVAVSFATVGEAMLLPILDEFDLIDTSLGQHIVGIGVIDDAIEITAVILTSILLGAAAGQHHVDIGIAIGSLGLLFLLAYGLTRLREEGKRLKVTDVEDIFLIVVFIFFLFISIGKFAEAAALGAVLAGVATRNFIPEERLEPIEDDLKSIAYGLFGPIFFVWVGAETNLAYLAANPMLILLVVAVTNAAKILGSWVVGHDRFGTRKSVFMGIGLSVRFSTSIVIIKLLHDGGVLDTGLYSVLIASTIVFKFLVPFLLSQLVGRWDIQGKA